MQILEIPDFLSAEECASYIEKSEALGYELAKVNTEKGQKLVLGTRNNARVIHYDDQLASELWEKLKPLVPKTIGNSKAVGLNECFRFYKYQQGQIFRRHQDESYIRNEREASYYTFMIYLNEGFRGGETTFANRTVQPVVGKALVFLHSLPHEGAEVVEGIKYVLRSDIMYVLA